jgi:hypothetical protein
MNKIGTNNESSLHNTLKNLYVGKNGKTEISIDGFICDGLSAENEIIEIQTGSFKPLYKKLSILSKSYKVKIIHPIILKKTIHLFDKNNQQISLRLSPKKGNPYDVFKALIYAPAIAKLKNVQVELVLVDIDEIRKQDGKGYWRRKGISIIDKVLSKKHDHITLSKLSDYKQFLPFKKSETISAPLLSKKAQIPYKTASMTIYTLNKLTLINPKPKKSRTKFYSLS